MIYGVGLWANRSPKNPRETMEHAHVKAPT